MALIHAIFNNLKTIDLKDGSVIKNFYEKAKGLSPEERGRLLVQDANFIEVHQALAAEGQTAAPAIDEKSNHHFIALVSFTGLTQEVISYLYFNFRSMLVVNSSNWMEARISRSLMAVPTMTRSCLTPFAFARSSFLAIRMIPTSPSWL